jgi:flavin reductase (DIM6/NTAB) family NADH-FMN oxidoreductase RutF
MVIDPNDVAGAVSRRLLRACVVPRPIALLSTVSCDGVRTLAPYSSFNTLCSDPPLVGFASSYQVPEEDTLANIRATREFVVNVVSEQMASQINACSTPYPSGVDGFKMSGLTPLPADRVAPPRVRESHVHLECRLARIVELSARPLGATLVIGEVVLFHIDDAITDGGGRVDPRRLQAIGRLGGPLYARTRDLFSMLKPRTYRR